MSLKVYASCPHCHVTNQSNRAVCWQCGSRLEHIEGRDGHAYYAADADSVALGRAQVQQLLDQAELYRAPAPQAPTPDSRRRRWWRPA